MAKIGKLLIKKYVYNNSKNRTAYGKTYGRVIHMGTLGTEQLAEHIQEHGSVYTDDVVIGVIRKMMHCIAEQLAAGYKVKLDGIGTLYVQARSMGVEDPNDYSVEKHIKNLQVMFLADQSDDSLYSKRGLMRCTLSGDLDKFGVTEDGNNSGGNSGGNDPVVDDQP